MHIACPNPAKLLVSVISGGIKLHRIWVIITIKVFSSVLTPQTAILHNCLFFFYTVKLGCRQVERGGILLIVLKDSKARMQNHDRIETFPGLLAAHTDVYFDSSEQSF